MSAETLTSSDAKQRVTFYAPQYRLRLGEDKVELHERGGDLLSVQFKDSVKELSALELVLNDFDDDGKKQPRFKYSGGGTLIELGTRFELEMGYADEPALHPMMVGDVIAFDPHFPASGAPTLTVRGLDRLHRLRNRPRSTSWAKMRDSEIANAIATHEDNKLSVGKIDETSPEHSLVPQDNKDDLTFLWERANRLDFEIFMRDDCFYFRHAPDASEEATLELVYGQSLISFEPTLTLSAMVSKLTVRSWHPFEGVLIEATADRDKLNAIAGGKKNAAEFFDAVIGDRKEEVLTVDAVLSKEDAQKLAEAKLRDRGHGFIKGSGQTVGIPMLRAGMNISLQGLPKRFSGSYYVTDTTHKIDASGYTTSFNARRAYVDA